MVTASKRASGFGPPDWRNVPAERVPGLEGDDDAAVRQVEAMSVKEALERFTGPALTAPVPYWSDQAVAKLKPAEKRAQRQVYDAAVRAQVARERLQWAFILKLSPEPAGRARLIEVAAADLAPKLRANAAIRLRDHQWLTPAELRAVAQRLDPNRWVGEVTDGLGEDLRRVYALGAMGVIASDKAGALGRLASLLAPKAKSPLEQCRARAVLTGLDDARRLVKPGALAGFTPHVAGLINHPDLGPMALSTLEVLPHDEGALARVAERLKASRSWDTFSLRLFSRTSNRVYIPLLAEALRRSPDSWLGPFQAFGNMGDPLGAAIIEVWLRSNAGPQQSRFAEQILSKLGKPSEAQLAEAGALLALPPKAAKRKSAR